jgi:sulfite reductase alpha subunit-like flavoprotein
MTDFYYQSEWELLTEEGVLTLLTAFSQDQMHKVYVQQALRQEDPGGDKLLDLLLTRQGHLYIAGGAKMARAAKEEIAELLAPHLGGETLATQFLSRLQRMGRFRVEAWS